MTMGKETVGAVRIFGVIDAGVSLTSLSVPGNLKKLFDGRRDPGFDIGGVDNVEEVGDPLVAFHGAVAANRDKGAEYELNKPMRPPDAAFVICP